MFHNNGPHQVDDISTVFAVSEHPYHSGSVSWGNSGGNYYLHRVDRQGYANIRKQFEDSRAGSGKSSRLRNRGNMFGRGDEV